MTRWMTLFVAVSWLAGACAAARGAQGASATTAGGARGTDLPASARAVVQTYCTQCHGPAVAQPAKGFGYVTDARKLVTNGKVVPGKPDDSPLYRTVNAKTMPPASARAGGLSAEQIEAIRKWIAAGAADWGAAPLPPTRPVAGTGTPGLEQDQANVLASGGISLAERFGRLHLQLVHFPIALLLAALLAEVLHRFRPAGPWRPCARYCLWLGAFGAVAAAATGWLLDSARKWTDAEEEFLEVHEWLGIATAVLAAGMVVLGWVLARRGGRADGWVPLAGAAGLGILVALTGHYGGLVAWGAADFLPW